MLQSLHPNQTLQAFVSGIFFKSLCLSLQGLGAGGCPALADALISVVLIDGTSVWGAACMELLAQRWIFHFPTPQNDISVSLAQFLNQQPPCCTPVTFRLWFWNALGCPKPYNSGFLLSSELEVGFWSQFSSFIQKKKRPGAVLEHRAEAHLLLCGGDVDIMLSLSSGMEDNVPRELCRAEMSLGTRTHG